MVIASFNLTLTNWIRKLKLEVGGWETDGELTIYIGFINHYLLRRFQNQFLLYLAPQNEIASYLLQVGLSPSSRVVSNSG